MHLLKREKETRFKHPASRSSHTPKSLKTPEKLNALTLKTAAVPKQEIK